MDNKEKMFWIKEKFLRFLAWIGVGLFGISVGLVVVSLAIKNPEIFVVIFIFIFGVWGITYLMDHS